MASVKRSLVVLTLTAALWVPACYTDPGPAPRGKDTDEAPEGFTTYRGSGYTFAYPNGWDITIGNDGYSLYADVEILGPQGPSELRPVISVTTPAGTVGDVDEAEAAFSTGAALLPNREVARKKALEISGAREALLLEDEYDQPVQDGMPLPPQRAEVKGIDIVGVKRIGVIAVDRGGRVFSLQLSSPSGEFDDDLFALVMDSFELTRRRPGTV